MTPERWQQIKQLYASAVKRDENERAAFLEDACAGDQELRREVESLLADQSHDEELLETPALDVAASLLAEGQAESLVGRQLGSHRILSLLGAGGMGEVYRARDTKLGREVALKVLPEAFASDPDRLRRFEQEARAAGRLDHPNILVIHDVGTHAGSPHLVTELLEGETLRARMG